MKKLELVVVIIPFLVGIFLIAGCVGTPTRETKETIAEVSQQTQEQVGSESAICNKIASEKDASRIFGKKMEFITDIALNWEQDPSGILPLWSAGCDYRHDIRDLNGYIIDYGDVDVSVSMYAPEEIQDRLKKMEKERAEMQALIEQFNYPVKLAESISIGLSGEVAEDEKYNEKHIVFVDTSGQFIVEIVGDSLSTYEGKNMFTLEQLISFARHIDQNLRALTKNDLGR